MSIYHNLPNGSLRMGAASSLFPHPSYPRSETEGLMPNRWQLPVDLGVLSSFSGMSNR